MLRDKLYFLVYVLNAGYPSISHLFFLMTISFFVKLMLTRQKLYDVIFRLFLFKKLTLKNSLCFFDKLVPLQLQQSISLVLLFLISYGTYFGLSCLIGRSRRIFQFVKD